MSDKRYEYKVQESTVDVRNYTIECNEELGDDIYSDIVDMICQVDCTKEGDSAECRVNGVKCVVTYDETHDDTDGGFDGQIHYNMNVYEDVLEDGEWSSVATIYPERSDV